MITPVDPQPATRSRSLTSPAASRRSTTTGLTLGGATTDKYYVSFNNVAVGKLEGSGLVSCRQAWNVKSPKVIVNQVRRPNNNATQFAQGYFSVLTRCSPVVMDRC